MRQVIWIAVVGMTLAICANWAAGANPASQPAKSPARAFNSKLKLQVWILKDLKDNNPTTLGETPATKPLAIPEGADWLVYPGEDPDLQAVATEVKDQHIPGLQLRDASDEDLALFKDATSLQILRLDATAVTDKGLESLKNMQSLRALSLVDDFITDVGLKSLKDLKALQTLNIRGTKATEAGVTDLRKALPGCQVTWEK